MTKNTLKEFEYEGVKQKVIYVETVNVVTGVICDVYKFENDSSKDLGIIKISKGHTTPLQKVKKGTKTIEGYIRGKGRLTIDRCSGEHEVVEVGKNTQTSREIVVMIDDVMQWQCDLDEDLVVYEICYPPYEEGRFVNLN